MRIYGREIKLSYLRRKLPIRQEKEIENLQASNKNLEKKLEEQKLLTKYVAEMSDIYIPEEQEDDDVPNTFENEETV